MCAVKPDVLFLVCYYQALRLDKRKNDEKEIASFKEKWLTRENMADERYDKKF